ncbi:GerMN domain-containing protein [Fusobacterium mortiferum]|uniref:GerMN domain-containing protein n=1 Tax=Fusobacterium mortiferum TaxID=850 RepID=UPI0022DF2F08|nr:GerMN domain-containing protein [Fusobacterium mortiferum]
MNKKLIAVVCIIWGIVIVSGVIFFQMRSSSKKINIIEITNKEKVVTEEGKVEKINFYVVSDNVDKLLRKEKEIPLYIKPKDKIRKIVQVSMENLWESKILKTSQIEIGNIFIKGDMLYIDVDANMLELKVENRKNLLAIYSIVNSVTEIGNIRKIKFLIDGKEEKGSFSKIYTRNTNI